MTATPENLFFSGKVYYFLAAFFCVLHCLKRTTGRMVDIADYQIRAVNHVPVTDLNGCLWMTSRRFIANLDPIIIVIKRIGVLGILCF